MKALSLTLLAALASLNLMISPAWAETSAEDFFQQGQILRVKNRMQKPKMPIYRLWPSIPNLKRPIFPWP